MQKRAILFKKDNNNKNSTDETDSKMINFKVKWGWKSYVECKVQMEIIGIERERFHA